MKKQLVASLAATMVLGVAGTAFAATNPFIDVPAKHWAYDSVTKLAQAGIIDGYSDGQYQGDKTISRYEMAQIVAKAMTKSDKADASQKAIIHKLSVEFASELEGLHVRVTKIEKNTSSVKITGEVRLRYENTTYNEDFRRDMATGVEANSSTNVLRTRLALSGNINDDWTYAGRLENNQNLRTAKGDHATELTIANVRGHIGGIDTTIGRQEYISNYGLLLDTKMDGVKLAFGNVLKTNIYYGKNEAEGMMSGVTGGTLGGHIAGLGDYYIGGNPYQNIDRPGIKTDILGADFQYATSPVTKVTAGIYELKFVDIANKNKLHAYEVGFDSQITPNLLAKASYAKVTGNNANGTIHNHNKAYFIGFDYKVADSKKTGSYSIFTNYRNIEENADLVPTFDNASLIRQLCASTGGKGYEVGFKYVPMANSMFTTKFVAIQGTGEGMSDLKANYYQAQMEFFF